MAEHEAREDLVEAAHEQLRGWFGREVDEWRLIRRVRVPRALPAQEAGAPRGWPGAPRVRPNVFLCGDHVDTASIQGAMVSGRRAAEALLAS